MKEILPVPVALAKKYLDDNMFKKYKKSFESFYSHNPDYGLIDFTLRELPKGCEAAKDLAIKRYQLLSMNTNLTNNEKRQSIKNSSDSVSKMSLMNFIQLSEYAKEEFRKQTVKEYGIEIPF
ncbi:MAG: hypothetical protein MUP55_04205 [Candidatus Aenigmarchaeota archaeon]|nr:hypothetical protein [Candidatus Aenigmarchaeota archaeon]